LIRNNQAKAQLREIQNARNVKGSGIYAHAAVKTDQRNAMPDVRVRKAYAVDCSSHFSPQSNAKDASAQSVHEERYAIVEQWWVVVGRSLMTA
jgi:hypothetical protein